MGPGVYIDFVIIWVYYVEMAEWRLPFSRSRSRSPQRKPRFYENVGSSSFRVPNRLWQLHGDNYWHYDNDYFDPIDRYTGDRLYGHYTGRYMDFDNRSSYERVGTPRFCDRLESYDDVKFRSNPDFKNGEFGNFMSFNVVCSNHHEHPHHESVAASRDISFTSKHSQTSMVHCNICDVYMTNEDQLKQHLLGTEHLKMSKQSDCDTVDPVARDAISVKVCVICGKHSEAKDFDAEQHKGSERHQKWMGVFAQHQKDYKVENEFHEILMSSDEIKMVLKLEENPDGYRCEQCDVNLRNYSVYKQHIKGQRHQKLLRKKTGGEDNDTKHHCNVCGVDIQGERSLKAHLAGQKHSKNVSRNSTNSSSSASVIENTASEGFHCAICDVNCTSLIDFDKHMNGKKHLKKSKLSQNIKKEE